MSNYWLTSIIQFRIISLPRNAILLMYYYLY